MEIEAKYAIPSEQRFEQLRLLDSLGPYPLRGSRTTELRDTYLDKSFREFFLKQDHAGGGMQVGINHHDVWMHPSHFCQGLSENFSHLRCRRSFMSSHLMPAF